MPKFKVGEYIMNGSYTFRVHVADGYSYGLEVVVRKREKRLKYKPGELVVWSKSFTEKNFSSATEALKNQFNEDLEAIVRE